ncbi:MAG: ABC transporter ATP-binding protein [Treponema sp.]|nr:ABC transporter ATP-binding protein [Treponema sp.]
MISVPLNKPLLEVKNLLVKIAGVQKSFTAVDNISFNIYPGEICGIVGESGCGKSLTALSIPGLLPPAASAEGSVFFKDRDLLGLSEAQLCGIRGKEISMIFQEPLTSLNPLMKIGRQITEVLEIHGEKKDRRQNRLAAVNLMQKLGLENPARTADSYPFMLSGGMCQRVMIALAMICGPDLLIADEPTTALDLDTQNQILALLREINSAGTTILFISHDLEVIRSICSRVLVMYAGKIVEEGSVDEVFNRPAHEYTGALLGALVEKNQRGEKLKVIPGKVPSIEEDRSKGCPFMPRCNRAIDVCGDEFPPGIKINKNHSSRCVLAANLQDSGRPEK